MSARYALQGAISGDLLSYGGKVLVHHDKGELEALLTGVRIVVCPRDIPEDQTLPLRFHPGLAHLSWPLDKRSFR